MGKLYSKQQPYGDALHPVKSMYDRCLLSIMNDLLNVISCSILFYLLYYLICMKIGQQEEELINIKLRSLEVEANMQLSLKKET